MVTMTTETSDTGDIRDIGGTGDPGGSVAGARADIKTQCSNCFVPSARTETRSVNTFIRYLKYANVDSSKESLGLFIFKLC